MNPENVSANLSTKGMVYRYSWVRLVRPMTWGGSIVPALVGTALANKQGTIHFATLVVLLVAAVLVQSATNMFNEYFDFLHGQDPENWSLPRIGEGGGGPSRQAIWAVAWWIIVVAVSLGSWLAIHSVWHVAPVGGFCILIGYLYSGGPKTLSALGLGELTAAVCMGPVIVVLAFVVQRPFLMAQFS